MTKCPTCNKGMLQEVMEKHTMYGIDLGTYPGEKCTSCKEVFTDAEVIKKIEAIAKEKGIWGIGQKTKITRTGNSLAIRIPRRIVNFLNLKEGEEAYLHPEGKKLIVEPNEQL